MSHHVFDKLEPALRRVFASTNRFSHLIISTRDGSVGFLISRLHGPWNLVVSCHHQRPGVIDEIREFCARQALKFEYTPHEAPNGTQVEKVRIDIFPEPQAVAEIYVHLLCDIFGIQREESMEVIVDPDPVIG